MADFRANSGVTGGGANLVVPQLLKSTRQLSPIATIASLLISKTNSKNCAQLEIRFIFCVSRLRERGDCYKPIPPPI